MSPITRLERWLDRRLGGKPIEGTEPDGWLTKVYPWMDRTPAGQEDR